MATPDPPPSSLAVPARPFLRTLLHLSLFSIAYSLVAGFTSPIAWGLLCAFLWVLGWPIWFIAFLWSAGLARLERRPFTFEARALFYYSFLWLLVLAPANLGAMVVIEGRREFLRWRGDLALEAAEAFRAERGRYPVEWAEVPDAPWLPRWVAFHPAKEECVVSFFNPGELLPHQVMWKRRGLGSEWETVYVGS